MGLKYITRHNEHAAEQCGTSWLNEQVMATEIETEFKYKIC